MKYKVLSLVLCLAFILLSGCGLDANKDLSSEILSDIGSTTQSKIQEPSEQPAQTQSEDIDLSTELQSQDQNQSEEGKTLKIEFLNVGQADSSLITLPDHRYVLIDGGNNKDGQKLVSFLKSKDITKIDYIIATHPHEDHIGGLDTVINNFDIGKIYMPRIHESDVPTTKTYEDFLDAVLQGGYKITAAKAGSAILDQTNLKLEFFAPNSENYNNLNNYSAVVKLTYGNTCVLFTGDAESVSENEMLKKNFDLECDILKVGHHGSNSSSTKKFLKSVKPKEAVISCGTDNPYGHPHKETLQRLEEIGAGANIHRTDLDGTIIVVLDGDSYHITKHKDINIDGN